MKLNKRIVAAATSVAMALAALSGGVPAQAANATTLTLGSLIEVKSWEPSQADLGHMAPLYQAAYDNLITRLPNGKYVGNLATKFTWDKSNTALTLELRKNVVFTDGAKFDAKVAKANLDAFIKGVDHGKNCIAS